MNRKGSLEEITLYKFVSIKDHHFIQKLQYTNKDLLSLENPFF
jgi:hypothetical protein